MPSSQLHYLTDFFTQVDTALATYVSNVSTSVISAFSPVATQLFILYVILWGWAMLRGMIAEPVTDGAARIAKIAIILGLALNAGIYNAHIADFLFETPDALASVITGVQAHSITNLNLLDRVLTKFFELGSVYWENASIAKGNVGLYLIALITWAFGTACTGFAAFLMILSKLALAVLLAVGPIFILSLMFDGTKRFFEAWLGQAINYVFLVIIAVSIINLILSVIERYTEALQAAVAGGAADPSQVMHVIPVILISLVAVLLLCQAPSIAASLGGGLQLSTLGAMGWAVDTTRGALGRLRPMRLERSYLRLRRDAQLVKGAARTVGQLPAAVYRRATQARRDRHSEDT